MISIAIDGPSGAGKSTIARAVASRRGFLYIDTGALYRAVGLYALRHGVDPGDEARVRALLGEMELSLRHDAEGKQHVLLCGEDVSEDIRTSAVSLAASAVAAMPAVREFLLECQRSLAREHDVVMDGRDIGTFILPKAQIKIFLTASSADRARRRFDELRARGEDITYEQVLADVEARDAQDEQRAVRPLRPAPDAVTVDTTGNTLEESIQLLDVLIGNKLRQL